MQAATAEFPDRGGRAEVTVMAETVEPNNGPTAAVTVREDQPVTPAVRARSEQMATMANRVITRSVASIRISSTSMSGSNCGRKLGAIWTDLAAPKPAKLISIVRNRS